MQKYRVVSTVFGIILAMLATATAAETEDASAKKYDELLQRLEAQEQRLAEQDKKIAEQDKKIAELEAGSKKTAELKSTELSPEQKQDFLKMYQEVKAQAEAKPLLPKWLTDLKWFADLRLRYHYETFSSTSKKDINKGRFRLRAGAKKTWFEEQLEAGFRLASGSNNDPSSLDQDFEDNFAKKFLWIDQAYAKYKPKAIKGLEIVGGKMENPFVNTNVVWDSDVNPEGVWAVYKCPIKPLQPFAGVGWFQTDESATARNATLSAYQGGVIVHLNEDTKWTTAGTYYDFMHYETTYSLAGGNTEAGGRLTAEEFDVVNVTSKLSAKAWGVPVGAWVDWAHNTKNALKDGTEDAYGVGVKLGQNKEKGDMSVAYKYAYIEANASPGAFNDSTFGHSNSRGHQVNVVYSLADFMTAGVELYYTQPVSGAGNDDPRFLALFDLIFNW